MFTQLLSRSKAARHGSCCKFGVYVIPNSRCVFTRINIIAITTDDSIAGFSRFSNPLDREVGDLCF